MGDNDFAIVLGDHIEVRVALIYQEMVNEPYVLGQVIRDITKKAQTAIQVTTLKGI